MSKFSGRTKIAKNSKMKLLTIDLLKDLHLLSAQYDGHLKCDINPKIKEEYTKEIVVQQVNNQSNTTTTTTSFSNTTSSRKRRDLNLANQ